MRKYLFLILFFLTLSAYSQSGMTFEELKYKISGYFDEALIKDIEKELPNGDNYRIWGWDVGDYSSDGYYDLAFAVRKFGVGNRKVDVFLFCDIEGYLVKVAQYEKDFYEIPLEVGIVIKDNVCYITQKEKQFHWYIEGYTFDNGNIILVDKFETEKQNSLTKETYKNFIDLKVKEKIIATKSGDVKHEQEFLTIPSYPRSSIVYKGFTNYAELFKIDNVIKGAYDWENRKDLSYKINSAYDKDFLYFHFDVNDDVLILPSCEDCSGDYLTIWFSIPQNKKDTNLIKVNMYLGDFVEEKASFSISSNIELDQKTKDYLSKLKVVSIEVDSGYSMKCKIPLQLLIDKDSSIDQIEYISFTSLIYDVDNEFKPENISVMASSKFDEKNSKHFGKIIFVSKDNWYGSSKNIYSEKILQYIKEYGF